MDYWFSIGPDDDDFEEPLTSDHEDGEDSVTPEDPDPEEDDEDRDAPTGNHG